MQTEYPMTLIIATSALILFIILLLMIASLGLAHFLKARYEKGSVTELLANIYLFFINIFLFMGAPIHANLLKVQKLRTTWMQERANNVKAYDEAMAEARRQIENEEQKLAENAEDTD